MENVSTKNEKEQYLKCVLISDYSQKIWIFKSHAECPNGCVSTF